MNILHIDASARPGRSDQQERGSHSRRLSGRFIDRWLAQRPDDVVVRRDVGLFPPTPVSLNWISAVFSDPATHTDKDRKHLAESDQLAYELVDADFVVMGTPIYNFGLPAQLKAWIDNVVRPGITFGSDSTKEPPSWPLLKPGKHLIILIARGDFGNEEGGRSSQEILVDYSLRPPMNYMGLTEIDTIAVEYTVWEGERLKESLRQAEKKVDELVGSIVSQLADNNINQ